MGVLRFAAGGQISCALPPCVGGGVAEESLPHVDLKRVEQRAKKLEEAAYTDSKRFAAQLHPECPSAFDRIPEAACSSMSSPTPDCAVVGIRYGV